MVESEIASTRKLLEKEEKIDHLEKAIIENFVKQSSGSSNRNEEGFNYQD